MRRCSAWVTPGAEPRPGVQGPKSARWMLIIELRCLFLGHVVTVATCFSGGAIKGSLAFSTPCSFARSHSFLLLLVFINA